MKRNLPVTTFDVLKATDPFLFECVRQDLRFIEKRGLDVPALDADRLPGYLRYMPATLKKHLAEVKGEFKNRMGGNEATAQKMFEHYVLSPEIEQFGFTMTVDYLSILNFEAFGKKTFFFTDNLTEHLALTNIETPADNLRLSFPSMMFVYTSPLIKQSIAAQNGQGEVDLETPVSVFVNETIYEGDRKLSITAFQRGFERFTIMVKRELLLKDDWNISDCLKTNWDIEGTGRDPDSKLTVVADDSVFYESEMLTLFRVVINSLLYLASNDPDIIRNLVPVRPPKIERSKNKFKIKQDHSSLKFSSVGDEILPFIIIERTAGEFSGETEKNGEKRTLNTRFIVRGHWRNQPYGEGLEKRKLIWIKPFYKGPDIGELINRPYVVK